ncbi:hypothetical protein D3C77_528440 [compost metagenome]
MAEISVLVIATDVCEGVTSFGSGIEDVVLHAVSTKKAQHKEANLESIIEQSLLCNIITINPKVVYHEWTVNKRIRCF